MRLIGVRMCKSLLGMIMIEAGAMRFGLLHPTLAKIEAGRGLKPTLRWLYSLDILL